METEGLRFFLTKCGLEIIGAVLADDIVVVIQVELTDALCYDEGEVHVSDSSGMWRETTVGNT